MSIVKPEVTSWIREKAIPLKSATAGAGYKDLTVLGGWVGDARVVGLGEATHDTREFFQLKRRMLEFLVSELGFTLFMIEAPFPESLAINRYVLTGEGDARHSLTSMGVYCWDCEEVFELIEWMRRWNAEHERKVFFYGCDTASYKSAVISLLDYLQRRDPQTYSRVRKSLQSLAIDMHALDMQIRSEAEKERAHEAISDLTATLAAMNADSMQGRRELEIARLQAVVLRQNVQLWKNAHARHEQSVRDRAMADNVASLLELHGPDSKAVVWAHNDHVALRSSGWLGITNPRLGQHLRERFGEEYVAFGFAFDRGSFGALDEMQLIRECTVSSEPGTLDAALAEAGPPVFALDLRPVPSGVVTDWFADAPASRCIGGAYFPAWKADPWIRCDIRTLFDALLFVRETSAAHHNPDAPYKNEFVREEPPAPEHFGNLDFSEGTAGWRTAQGALGYRVRVVLDNEGRAMEISRSAAFWPHDVFALSQTASAAPWRGKRITVRCTVSMEIAHHGSSAQLAIRVLKPRMQVDFSSYSPRKFIWQRMTTREEQTRELSLTAQVDDTADMIALALVITGDGRARFGPITIEGENEAL